MRVRLNGDLLRELISERGGVDAFLRQWSGAGKPPERTTVYRWTSGDRLPKNSDVFLRLAGFLDVDPFGLLAVAAGDLPRVADEASRILRSAALGPAWLRFARDFIGSHIRWPPSAIASVYFKRTWHLEEFTHDPALRANYYATVLLRPAVKEAGRLQVFHFAYKHPSAAHARWQQYGLVGVNGISVILHTFDGFIDQLERPSLDEPIPVETWFGPGPALFRIASLHPFFHELISPGDSATRALRFPG